MVEIKIRFNNAILYFPRYFYGEVSLPEKGKVVPTVYVVEEINLLNKLMRHNQKTLTHMLMVMKANDKERHFRKQDKQTVYNAVVTKGASLITFMVYTSHANVNRNPFIMFSTSHNSYIASGEPTVNVDEHGEVKLGMGLYLFCSFSLDKKNLYTFIRN